MQNRTVSKLGVLQNRAKTNILKSRIESPKMYYCSKRSRVNYIVVVKYEIKKEVNAQDDTEKC